MPIDPTTAQNVIRLARQHIGEEYVLGAMVSYDNANHRGPWDCAEFATWALYQGAGVLLGCKPKNARTGDAYTGFWAQDAESYGLKISVEQALATTGAMLLRKPRTGRVGHISISIGDGMNVVEAASRNLGVIEREGTGRPWDYGIIIPTQSELDSGSVGGTNGGGLVLRSSPSPRYDARVAALQDALREKGFDPGTSDGLFGSDTENAVINFQNSIGIVVDGIVGKETGQALGLPYWGTPAAPALAGAALASSTGVYNPKYDVIFDALTTGGFFSSDPDDLSVKRAVRTNNPGALNISGWQKTFPGFVSKTMADSHGNKTTIYRTPEHGVAAWYNLMANRYGFGQDGNFKIRKLARKYAGVDSDTHPAARTYIKGWKRWSGNRLAKNTVIHLNNMSEVLLLAKAMYAHESGDPSPLLDEQIRVGVNHLRDGTLPA